ncbi:MAG: ATP-dependent DNA helicase [Betaproteobacteria bacterium]
MNPPKPATPTPYAVAVRELCEFTARRGDLDLRFGGAPSAQEGMAGHALVAGRRGPDYQRELSLSAQWGRLTVRGRADGYDGALNRLEEVKTYRGRFGSITPEQQELHWAQAQIYGHLLCQLRGLADVELALVYLNLDDQQETVLLRPCSAASLQEFFEHHCAVFAAWAEQELAHQSARAQALQALAFPLAAMRVGQRSLAESVWRAARQGRCLLAQAPTGIGKTLGTVFPALKAMGAAGPPGMDKLFYLSAKSSGRDLALRALDTLSQDPQSDQRRSLRVLELLARDKACEHPDKACHGQSCPLALGYHDKLPAARAAAVAVRWLDGPALRELARQHEVCPYHLGQDMIAWSDVVVGDYNHWFDSHAALYALSLARGWRAAVLVDEAHNLVDRGRQMYSITLDEAALGMAQKSAPAELKKDLGRLRRHWRALRQGRADYSVLEQLPQPLLLAMQQLSAGIAAWQAEHPAQPLGPLHRLWFDLSQFLQRASNLGSDSLIDLSPVGSGSRDERALLTLRNVLPAPFLRPRFAAAHSCVLFSATLSPSEHYQRMLGLPDDAVTLALPSPFEAGQLQVRVLQGVSTRWQDRAQSLPTLVEVMARQWQLRPGKYLAFFSSFDYLRQASEALQQRHPQLPQWQQSARMDEGQQRAFVERFRSGEAGIGFAVLGGSFGEGIDLPGQQLIGAFIATLGLPQINPVNEEIRRRLQALLGRGHEHTYLYPGLRKVLQAAGRVIRSESDQGVLWLMDERYAQERVLALMPPWWQPRLTASPDVPPAAAAPTAPATAPAAG